MGTSINFNEKKGFICDMDGVIYHGNRILPGVAEFIQWLHEENKEYLFLTNNSGYTPRELNQKLARMGLDVPEEHFYTSALATAAFLREQAPGCSVFAQRPLRRGHHDERCEPRLCGRGRGAQLFARYAHKGDEPCDAGREAHRREFRRVRPHRKRHRARLPRTHRAHRDGDGQAGVFLRQAESTDDANGTENAELPLR